MRNSLQILSRNQGFRKFGVSEFRGPQKCVFVWMEDKSKRLATSVGTVNAAVLQFIHISESCRRRINITFTSNCRHTGSFYSFKGKMKKMYL